MGKDDSSSAGLGGAQQPRQQQVSALAPQCGGGVPQPEVGGGRHLVRVVDEQRARAPAAAQGHEEDVGAPEGENVSPELPDAGHAAPRTEAREEVLGAEPLPCDEDDDQERKDEVHHDMLASILDASRPLNVLPDADPGLGALLQDVLAPRQQDAGPQGQLEGQEDDHRQPVELDEEGQVVLAACHQATVWGQGNWG